MCDESRLHGVGSTESRKAQGENSGSTQTQASTSGIVQDNDDDETSVEGTTQNILFRLYPAENLVNGTLVLELPNGFSANTTSDYGPSARLTADQISDGGQTITITNLTQNALSQNNISLFNKVMPGAGSYQFKVYFDADGDGTAKSLSDAYVITYNVIPLP